MKVCLIQPPYYTDHSRSQECFDCQIQMLDRCDESLDLIVLPESADIPCLAHNVEERLESIERYNKAILDKSSETARRCSAHLFVNARYKYGEKYINATYAFDRNGDVAGIYYKQHPTPGEVKNPDQETGYAFEHSVPTVVELDGIRYAFLTCYDFYFYEAFPTLARVQPDIIIGCSHQRSDTHRALEIISQFLAYNTNAYVVRASVSMDESSDIGGASMVVAPTGETLLNMKSRIGMETVDIDPMKKYYKPAGFGNPPAAHYEYIEKGRRPWKYRPAGSAIVLPESAAPYPRVCAHRGFPAVCPENSMAGYGAAIGMGADEIELDLWETADGEIVSIHDQSLERVSNGTGLVTDLTLAKLRELDFGVSHGGWFKGMKLPTFEEILKKFACHVIMNVHVKPYRDRYSDEAMKKIVGLVRKYDSEKYVYFMLERDEDIRQFKAWAPDIPVCVGHDNARKWEIVERAIELGCEKVQFYKPYFNKEMVDKAHAHGIVCNVFWSDTPDEAEELLDMGMDTILTNNFGIVYQVVKSRR